jgi:hypothetical protein
MTDVKYTAGPYRAIGSGIYADAPQDVDHSHYKGFGEPEPDRGYLIAESIPHKPTRDLLAAAPDLLEALRYVEKRCVSEAAYPHASIEDRKMRDMVNAAIAKATNPTS